MTPLANLSVCHPSVAADGTYITPNEGAQYTYREKFSPSISQEIIQGSALRNLPPIKNIIGSTSSTPSCTCIDCFNYTMNIPERGTTRLLGSGRGRR